jgi:3-oxoacid CoA-transferase A subunit
MARENKIMTAKQALSHVKDGDRVMVGGFGHRGAPELLVEALAETGVKDITLISNDLASPDVGLGKLLAHKMLKGCIGNYYNWNKDAVAAYYAGELPITLIPQGTFIEAIRAAAYGIPAFYTPTGYGTELTAGHETREFNGRGYILQEAIHGDVALVKAYRADKLGNLVFYKTARNFNPTMAMAATYTIALVDEIVEPGELDPELIQVPHIYVNAIVKECAADD